jgi:RNA polymerase sigma-19 factor, ECF subfamily
VSNHLLDGEIRLVKSLSEGNLLAFNTLFKKYSGQLFRFANGYLKSEAESEELVQEVFTIIWEKRAELKHELSFKSYLFTIAYNIIRKHFRNRRYLSAYLQSGMYDDMDMQTSQNITYNSLYQYLKKLVDLLPVKRREIFIRSRFEGFSIKEISEEFNISHKTVENQLTDALKFIRSNIKNENIPVILFFFLFLS